MRSAMSIGVSPAFVISMFGEKFTIANFRKALGPISESGFAAVQLEIYSDEKIGEWEKGIRELCRQCSDLNLKVSQFVAHFAMSYFTSPSKIRSNAGHEEIKRVIGISKEIDPCPPVTIPLGPFKIDHTVDSPRAFKELRSLFLENMHALLRSAEREDARIAAEIPPFCLINGSDAFLELHELLGSDRLGINLDTGHAWARKEDVTILPFKLAGKIFGTHLCDNLGAENLSLAPGAGSIDWETFARNLAASGYGGGLDVEIHCRAGRVLDEYRRAREFVERTFS
jgi:sugar phosphate isomerase/epimerase